MTAVQGANEVAAGIVVLVFRLDGREHALPVEDVVEVLRMVAPTPLPEAPPWMCGVIDLRGQVIPLIDLRTRLGAPEREPDLSTPIIAVQANDVAAGLVVDEVVEVLALPGEAVDPASFVSAATPSPSAVSGVAHRGDRLVLVLDTQRLLEGSADLGLPADVEDTREARL